MKKQFTITIEPELMLKLDTSAREAGISRNAAISLLISRFHYYIAPFHEKQEKRKHNSFTCKCKPCQKEQDEGERAFEDDYQNSRP